MAQNQDKPYTFGPQPFPDALAGKILEFPACGCTVLGEGNLQRPVKIIYCPTHAAAFELLAALKALTEGMDNKTCPEGSNYDICSAGGDACRDTPSGQPFIHDPTCPYSVALTVSERAQRPYRSPTQP